MSQIKSGSNFYLQIGIGETLMDTPCIQIDNEPSIGEQSSALLSVSEIKINTSKSKCRSCFFGGSLLRGIICIFYGILPSNIVKSGNKRHHSYISLLLLCLQWLMVSVYIYCIKTYWTSGNGPRIPIETMVIMIALNTSAAVSFTLTIAYFYNSKNNFQALRGNCNKFRVIPKIPFKPDGSEDITINPSESDWFLTNVLFFLGIISISGTLISAFALNAFLDFYGIHNFTLKISGAPIVLYFIAVGTVYWSFCATITTCCLFHVMSRDLINHIHYTEKLIIKQARNRVDFFVYHNALLQYTRDLMCTMKYWFAIHSVFFIFLITATVFEWINAIKRTEDQRSNMARIWFSQLTGSLLIAYKFAFPFFSASRITARFIKFYHNIARESTLPDLPNLTLLRDESGFRMCGVRITTNLALLAILSSFIGALKFIADFYSTG
eukprot:gene19794-21735_t